MITTSTVFILGAGASAPYGFDTGGQLLERARRLTVDQVAEVIRPLPPHGATLLQDALEHTGDLSIDAMLETRGEIQAPGKALIAALLLQQERDAKRSKHTTARDWYRTVFTAMDAPTPREAVSQPVHFVTFNYDRSLEYRLAHAWRVKFTPDQLVEPTALQRMVIHLHGQLAFLPEVGGTGAIIPYGGSEAGITEDDVLQASRVVKIVSEPRPEDTQFARAREVIAAADRIIFLGFAFARRNVARLQLERMKDGAALYICRTGLSQNQVVTFVRPWAERWPGRVVGNETEDAYEFLRLHPQALS